MFKVSTQCFLIKSDEVLFLHRTKKENDINKDMYIGLGGKLETNETPEECIVREVKEEAGVTLVKPKLRGVITFPLKNKIAANTSDYWITFLYTASKWEGDFTDECDEGELKWIDKKDIKKLNLWEGDLIFLDLLLNNNRFFELDLVYDNDKLIEHSITFFNSSVRQYLQLSCT